MFTAGVFRDGIINQFFRLFRDAQTVEPERLIVRLDRSADVLVVRGLLREQFPFGAQLRSLSIAARASSMVCASGAID